MKYAKHSIEIPKFILNIVYKFKVSDKSYHQFIDNSNILYELYIAKELYYDTKWEKEIELTFYYLVNALTEKKIQPNKGYSSKRGLLISITKLLKKEYDAAKS